MEAPTKREILAESPLFENLLPAELSLLADLFTEREYEAEEIVFSEGDVGDALYVVAAGEVEIVRQDSEGRLKPLATLEAPQFFGEMSLIDKEYRSATVRAKGRARLLQLTNDNLHVFAKNYRNGFTWVVVNIARVLSSRLRDVNGKPAEQL